LSVIVGQTVNISSRATMAGGGENAGLAHAAPHLLAHAPRLFDKGVASPASAEPTGAASPLLKADADTVRRGDQARRRFVERHRRIPQPRAIDMQLAGRVLCANAPAAST
jgi:hypothetical protein